jgi:hypothetical protein
MIKYTKEQEIELLDAYSIAEDAEEREIVVMKFTTKFSKPKRSIIAKLSKMGVYVSKASISKVTGSKPETKEQLVTRIEDRFGVEDGDWIGLEKAPKLVLVGLLTKLIQPK